MKKNLHRALTAAVLAAMLVGTAVAASTATTKMIEANYSGIKLVVDGVEVTPKVGDKVVEPFISEGVTYLPVRPVGEALGKEVSWDGVNRIVYIGQVPNAEDNWMVKVPAYQVKDAKVYDGSDRKATFEVAGKTQTQGVTFSASWSQAFAIWNTNAEYGTMHLTVGHMGSKTNDAKLEVYLDGEFSTEYELKYDAAPKTLNIPLRYAPNVKLNFTGVDSDSLHGDWGIYDISFS